MRKLLTTVLILSFTLPAAFSQIQDQEIVAKKVFGGYKYTQNGMPLNYSQMSKIMSSNPEAVTLIKKAKTTNTFASILSFTGGFLIGWPIGTALGGGEPNWTMAAIGAGLLVLDIPLISSINKNTSKAVNIYNKGIQKPTGLAGYNIKLGLSPVGAEIRFIF